MPEQKRKRPTEASGGAAKKKIARTTTAKPRAPVARKAASSASAVSAQSLSAAAAAARATKPAAKKRPARPARAKPTKTKSAAKPTSAKPSTDAEARSSQRSKRRPEVASGSSVADPEATPNSVTEKGDAAAAAAAHPLVTYAIDTSDTARERCAMCRKNIPKGALRFGRLTRADRRTKKRDAQTEWWHQACFAVPVALVHLPPEQIRGWSSLTDKEQRRVRELLAAGEGATFRSVAAAAAAAAKAAAEAVAEAAVVKSARTKPHSAEQAPVHTGPLAANGVTPSGEHVRFD
ncbi:hypothetical protein THASP1DRAFT_29160 [Thamnocephalis sphaerospora]|uniref:PARP-type domain-containing protein n=1 Tax=Thamnocephalis sphaerospora TaxID=78915 RepID=A0A4P9XSF0_9FUNG|nr:hypothetical protein THASP1DRAFT_29160 [Thamnocephalis sphaerospora]|eukprot:RKP09053.1 hypothetical protein THASP1DRAFT_29160 [Thamnocephalis sphaerospora]